MSYNQPPYGRPVQVPPQPPTQQIQRGYARPAYSLQQQYYYPPQGQQYIQMAPGMPQYTMMQYPPQQPSQQSPVYMTEEQYKMTQQMRYVQPQQIIYQTPTPSSVFPESRKKKKESTPKKQTQIQNFQSNAPTNAPVVVSTPVNSNTFISQSQSLEQFIPKINQTRKLNMMESNPPGCFNIIRRGCLPGITFSQICSVK